jgi:hypothetical protein
MDGNFALKTCIQIQKLNDVQICTPKRIFLWHFNQVNFVLQKRHFVQCGDLLLS